MIKDKVKETILNNHLIETAEHIVVGLSGGPDSVCLFHILNRLKTELDFSLTAVHINHGLRPGAADEDQRYSEQLCFDFGIPCHTFFFDVKKIAKDKGMTGEEAGRQVRYQSFFEVAHKIISETGKNVKIAVAQNMNDQAETVLMRILRGTGTDGLCGIEYIRRETGKGIVIRPLLDVSREEIESYCREHKLEPRIDLTNLEPLYTRNKIRLELLPLLQETFNSNMISVLNRLSKIAKEDREYFSIIVEEAIKAHSETTEKNNLERFPISVLMEMHPALRHRVIRRLFEEIGLSKDIASIHLEQADKLLEEARTSSVSDFPSGYAMKINYGFAEFYKKEKIEKESFEYEIDINKDSNIEICELNARIGVKILRRQDWENVRETENYLKKNSFGCSLSLDKIEACGCVPILRTRKQGDYIVPFGMTGRKKLQDFFVDGKIDRVERDKIPLLCLGPEVVWVVGNRINENYKVEKSTERIIILEISSI